MCNDPRVVASNQAFFCGFPSPLESESQELELLQGTSLQHCSAPSGAAGMSNIWSGGRAPQQCSFRLLSYPLTDLLSETCWDVIITVTCCLLAVLSTASFLWAE